MKFGVREICNVVFKAKNTMKIGNTTFAPGQPVLYIDSAKTSSMEGAATSVYATGGRGNTRLIAWEGERTLTFTVEDALLSPISFSMLSGAGVVKGGEAEFVNVHTTVATTIARTGSSSPTIDLKDAVGTDAINTNAPMFIVPTEEDGSLNGGPIGLASTVSGTVITVTGNGDADTAAVTALKAGDPVMVDFYIKKKSSTVTELQIDAERFGGYFYVEASTLFRKQSTGKDLPAEITFPNVKIQSNFTFSMASTGDPSTFTFTMDAFPGSTYFDPTRKVLCVIQVVDDEVAGLGDIATVMGNTEVAAYDKNVVAADKDSNVTTVNKGL